MCRELKENMIEAVKEGIMTMSHHIKITNKERLFLQTKKNEYILESESTITKMKNH